MPLRMNLIANVDANFGIGKNNDLPWHLPKEYAHFVRETTKTLDQNKKNAVILGRKCWESVPAKFRPLKDRINVVVSRTMEPKISDDFVVSNDFEDALRLLAEDERFKNRIETIWNVGGTEIYKLGLEHPWMHKLVLTKMDTDFGCDIKFPDVNWEQFEKNSDFSDEKLEEMDKISKKMVTYKICSYTKKGSENI
uniref:dihydrofolate reductase n=1 Tax=Acrobeloides nanus TaxID=290746 RepID=A0A914DQY8_9BILA